MKPLIATLCAVFSTLSMGSSYAADAIRAKELATRNACLGCHAVASRLVGPAYAEVAARYKGMDPSELAERIKAGGTGKWGTLEMPAQASLALADAKLLAEWILAGSPER